MEPTRSPPSLDLIKGGGGALLMEKIIASASKQFVVIADHTKQVSVLGHAPVPVEVISQAQAVLAKKFTSMGALVQLRQYTFGNPYITEEGHQILDCLFNEIEDPARLGKELDSLPGVVEHGLFVGMANVVLIAKGTEVAHVASVALVFFSFVYPTICRSVVFKNRFSTSSMVL